MYPVRFGRLVVLVVFVLLTAACGDGDTETTTAAPTTAVPATTAAPPSTTQPTTTDVPTTTTTTTTTTAAPATTAPTTTLQPIAELPLVEDAVGGTPSGDGWLVDPGVYTSDHVGVPIRLEITDQVALVGDRSLSIGRPYVRFSKPDMMFFFTPVGIMPADVVGIHPPHDSLIPVNMQEMPDDLQAWFDSIPQIVILDSEEGEGWRSWDVMVDASAGQTFDDCGRGNCVATFVSSAFGPILLWDTADFRIWEFNGAGDGLIGFMQSDPSTVDTTTALAEMLLDGLSFE